MSKRILVVDDEIALTRMVKMNLENAGDHRRPGNPGGDYRSLAGRRLCQQGLTAWRDREHTPE